MITWQLYAGINPLPALRDTTGLDLASAAGQRWVTIVVEGKTRPENKLRPATVTLAEDVGEAIAGLYPDDGIGWDGEPLNLIVTWEHGETSEYQILHPWTNVLEVLRGEAA